MFRVKGMSGRRFDTPSKVEAFETAKQWGDSGKADLFCSIMFFSADTGWEPVAVATESKFHNGKARIIFEPWA